MAVAEQLDNFSVRRPDTLELSLPNYMRSRNNNISRTDFCKSVFESLGDEAKGQIKCIQRSSSGTNFRVTFKPGQDDLRDKLLIEGIHLYGNFCYFLESESRAQVVTVFNLPTVGQAFTKYGFVRSVSRPVDRWGIETGDRKVLIQMQYHIPNLVFIGKFPAIITYPRQPMCCHHCNWWGHRNRHCPFSRACRNCGDKDHTSDECIMGYVPAPAYPVTGQMPVFSHPFHVRASQDSTTSSVRPEVNNDSPAIQSQSQTSDVPPPTPTSQPTPVPQSPPGSLSTPSEPCASLTQLFGSMSDMSEMSGDDIDPSNTQVLFDSQPDGDATSQEQIFPHPTAEDSLNQMAVDDTPQEQAIPETQEQMFPNSTPDDSLNQASVPSGDPPENHFPKSTPEDSLQGVQLLTPGTALPSAVSFNQQFKCATAARPKYSQVVADKSRKTPKGMHMKAPFTTLKRLCPPSASASDARKKDKKT